MLTDQLIHLPLSVHNTIGSRFSTLATHEYLSMKSLDLYYTFHPLLHDVLKDNKISDEGEDYKQL